MTESTAPQPEHPAGAYLRLAGIIKAAIIDDAFDPPTREAFRDEILDFWDAVVRSPELMEELQGIKEDLSDESEIDDEILIKLWEARDELPGTGPLLKERLFGKKLEMLASLDELRAHLLRLGIEPIPVGTEEELPGGPIKLVFIDYFLGPGNDSSAVNAATARAGELYRSVRADEDKPFIVLMSSRPDADAARDTFREASKLLGGLFGYVSKADLRDREKLYLHLSTWALGMPKRHEIQHFVEALESSVKVAAEVFISRVRALGFEDYANIQWLSLQADGHPLGDYMLWLYKSLLAYLLHDNSRVLEQQKKLDSMSFEEFTPGQDPPSPQLAEIYRYALTEPGVEEVGGHPRSGGDSEEPYLQLGDLFFKDQGHDVMMVANAACDLAYAPGKKRVFPKDRPILLIPGRLQRQEEFDTSDFPRTELFKHDGRAYRIVWDHKRVVTKEYGKIRSWQRRERFSRKARLTLPYALEVQQAFAMHVMRIGMPVRPATYRRADVEVYCEGDGGRCIHLVDPIREGAVIIRHRMEDKDQDEDLFVLTLDCIGKVSSGLGMVIEQCERQKEELIAELPEEGAEDPETKRAAKIISGKIKGVEGKLRKLERLKLLSEEWVPLVRKPSPLPGASKRFEVNKKLLWVYHEKNFEGSYDEDPPIALNIRSGEQAEDERTMGPDPKGQAPGEPADE